MASLISLDLLKSQCRVTHDEDDEHLERFCEEATAIVLDYLEASDRFDGDVSPEDWTEETVPLHVRAAILHAGTYLYRHRGDEDDAKGPLTDAVMRILERTRNPVIA